MKEKESVKKLKKAMSLLYLVIDEDVANELNKKIRDVMSDYEQEIEKLKTSLLELELEPFSDYCTRIKEENPNAPWEDESVESLYDMYRKEKTEGEEK